MRPIGEKVAVKLRKTPTTTASGLHLPETATNTQTHGDVIAVGKDVKTLKVGDMVIYLRYSGLYYEDENGDTIVIVPESELMAYWRAEKN